MVPTSPRLGMVILLLLFLEFIHLEELQTMLLLCI